MKNIEALNLNPDVQSAVLSTDANYRRHLSVAVDILEVVGNTVTVRVAQTRNLNGTAYEPKELIEKAKEVLSHIPEGRFKYQFRPLVWKGEGLESVDADWVKRRMEEHGIKQADIMTALGSDKQVISKLLSGKYGFTTAWKAAFWYYFLANPLPLVLEAKGLVIIPAFKP